MGRLFLLNLAVWSGVAVAAERALDAAYAPRPEGVQAPAPPAAASESRVATMAWPERTALAALDDRPPFSPTRRPAPPAAVAATPLAAPSVTLVGVAGASDALTAYARIGARTMRVRAGDEIAGWRVDEIGPRRLVLRLGGATVEALLAAPGGAGGQAAPAGAAGDATEPSAYLDFQTDAYE